MPENIVIQVGQCGNQIGTRFWNKIIQEHAVNNKNATFDESFSTFFKNYDKKGRYVCPRYEDSRVHELKARAILVDMEEGVLNRISKTPFSELLDPHQIITSQSGSGNNWAVGYTEYGESHGELIMDSIRIEVEKCDALSSFFMLHSLGGGTGSGLGSFISEKLMDSFPEVYRFSAVVCPSENDDVVTSPYNSLLSLDALIRTADCVLPIENQALLTIYKKIISSKGTPKTSLASQEEASKAFDSMNNIISNLLLNMTSSMRFEGSLNVDINDIVTNLVPFPRLKFLSSSMTPLYTAPDLKSQPRRLENMFTDAFNKDCQLFSADVKSGLFLACAVIARGKEINLSDMRFNIDRQVLLFTLDCQNISSFVHGIKKDGKLDCAMFLLSVSNLAC